MLDASFFKVVNIQSQNTDHHYNPRKIRAEVANAPCDACENKDKCRTQLLACQHYAVWLDFRTPNKSHAQIPSRSIYKRLFRI